MQTVEGEQRSPVIWRHDRSGALSCAYDGGERVFTWLPADVADMAQKWRSSSCQAPDRARAFLETHERLEVLVREAGLGPPDAVIFHLGRAELKAVWDKERVVLVVEKIPKRRPKPRANAVRRVR